MDKKVEGVYPNVEEALRAVDRLRMDGHSRDEIRIVTNKEVRNTVDTNLQENITVEEGTDRSENDESMWESIKDFFTPDDSSDFGYANEDDPLYLYRDSIEEGKVVVLVNDDDDDTDNDTGKKKERPIIQEQPNTLGSKGASKDGDDRAPDFDQLNVDKELRTDDLEDYQRRQ